MKKIFLIVFITFISTMSFSEIIDLATALKMAEEGNTDIKIENLEIRKRELEVSKNKKKFLPELNFIYGENDYSSSYDPFKNHSGEDDEITVKMPLFVGFENINRLKKSKLELEQSHNSSSQLKKIIRQSVISKYFQILNLQRQKKIVMATLEAMEERNERLKVLYENKLLLNEKFLDSKANIAYTQTQLKGIETDLENAMYEFKYLLNMPLDAELKVSDAEKIDLDLEVEGINLEEDLLARLTTGSKMTNLELEIEMKKMDVKIARAKYYPKIWIEASNNYTYASKGQDDSRISIMAEWNIFRWGADADSVEQNKISVEQAKLLQAKLKQDIFMDMKIKYDAIERIKLEQQAQEYMLQSARESLERAEVRYRNAHITFSEYISVQNALRQNEKKYFGLKEDLILAIDTYKNGWK